MIPVWLAWVVIISFGASCFALGGSITFLVLLAQKRIRP